MKKFKYNMQSILDITNRLEEQAKGVFALAKQRYDMETEKLQKLENEKKGYEEALRNLMLDRLDFMEIQATKAGIVSKEDAMKKQLRLIKAAERELEAARERLKELMIERKTHETLKEKAWQEYRREELSEEMKEIDELVSYRFNHSK